MPKNARLSRGSRRGRLLLVSGACGTPRDRGIGHCGKLGPRKIWSGLFAWAAQYADAAAGQLLATPLAAVFTDGKDLGGKRSPSTFYRYPPVSFRHPADCSKSHQTAPAGAKLPPLLPLAPVGSTFAGSEARTEGKTRHNFLIRTSHDRDAELPQISPSC